MTQAKSYKAYRKGLSCAGKAESNLRNEKGFTGAMIGVNVRLVRMVLVGAWGEKHRPRRFRSSKKKATLRINPPEGTGNGSTQLRESGKSSTLLEDIYQIRGTLRKNREK